MYAVTIDNAYLHTDGRFYIAFIDMRGCHPVIYKTERNAAKRAKRYKNAQVMKLDFGI